MSASDVTSRRYGSEAAAPPILGSGSGPLACGGGHGGVHGSAPGGPGGRGASGTGRCPGGADGPAPPQATAAAEDAPLRHPPRPWGPRADGADWPERCQVDLGPVRLSLLRPPGPPAASEVTGRPDSGLRTWCLVFAVRGPLAVGGGGPAVRLEPGDLVLCGPAASTSLAAVGGQSARAAVLHLPERALPLPGELLRVVTGRPAPTRSGPAALLASFMDGLAAQAPLAGEPHTAWLGSAAVSLATAFLDGEAGACRAGPPPHLPHLAYAPYLPPSALLAPEPAASPTDGLLTDIKTYVEHRLGDADLAPAAIARAHHISLRYLHHLFQRDRQTVCGFLRERRLERCRTDLADPQLAGRSVATIGSRWGFRDPTVFNRTFRSAYGVTPGAYRRQRLRT